MPDSKIQFFGSFFLLWRCFWLLITILHRSLSLSWRSIPSPITTFLLLRMPGSSKMAKFYEIRCHSSSPYSLYIHRRLQRCYINWMDCTTLKKIVPIPDSKIQFFGSFFLLWRCFFASNHDFHRSLSLFWRSIPSPITTFRLLRMPGSSKMKIGPIF